MDPVLSENIEHYSPALGRLVLACSKLEACLTDLISAATGMHIFHAIMTVHHSQFANKADTLLSILNLQVKDDQEYEPIITLVSQAKAVGEFRNSIVHAIWTFDEDGTGSAVRFSARGHLTRTKKPMQISEIVARSNEGFALAEKLEELARRLRQRESNSRDLIERK